jgi:hypothetical protein
MQESMRFEPEPAADRMGGNTPLRIPEIEMSPVDL